MSRVFGSWFFFLLFILVDFYVFQALRALGDSWHPRVRWWLYLSYWSITLISAGLIISVIFQGLDAWPQLLRTYVFAVLIGFFIAKITASVFFVADDMRRLMQWSASFFIKKPHIENGVNTGGIPRSVFMSWLGLISGGSLFGTLLYGFGNKYRYEVRKHRLHFPNLPEAFRGFRIVHISDIHSGSFTDKEAVAKGVNLIQKQNADLILFTGDLVNQSADEMDPYVDLFAGLKAQHGVYATLGNHDYGFPMAETEHEKLKKQQETARAVESVHRQLGWKTLSNQFAVIEINDEKIVLIGVENISGKPNFPSYGKLNEAYRGTEAYPFKILLSHDPSHWNKEVTTNYKDINLTLSGHTHGMQFGVELPWFKWSPVKYFYKQWAGHYKEGNQHLYVNRGFGFIGYPGRVGILPEITVLELV